MLLADEGEKVAAELGELTFLESKGAQPYAAKRCAAYAHCTCEQLRERRGRGHKCVCVPDLRCKLHASLAELAHCFAEGAMRNGWRVPDFAPPEVVQSIQQLK